MQKENTSDATVLMKVDDLINAAMGPENKNRVDFKLLRHVLHVLARQMRILEQTVELHIEEDAESSTNSSDDES